MMADNKMKLGVILSLFVFVLIGINLLTPVGDSVKATDDLGVEVNETITIASGTGTLANSPTNRIGLGVAGVSFFSNASGTPSDTTITTSTTRVNFSEAGIIIVNESLYGDQDYNVSYTWYTDGYVQDATSRTLLSFLTLFFVLAILAIAIGKMKDMFGDQMDFGK